MRPCTTCPFLMTSTLGLWHPAHLIQIAYLLSAQVPHQGSMGCHEWNGKHPGRDPQNSPPCGGWVRVAHDSIGVRLLLRSGQVAAGDLDDVEGLALYADVTSMLYFNGIDIDKLPQLDQPRTKRSIMRWLEEIDGINKLITMDKETARFFIMEGSPLAWGVDDDGNPLMPAEDFAQWLKHCQQWAAERAALADPG